MIDYQKACPSVKLVFLGDSGVGKSCIISKFSSGVVPTESLPTVGAAYYSKVVSVDQTKLELRIWDTAGQETYHSLTPIYFRGSSIAFVVFDITNRKSFSNLRNWISLVREYGRKGIVIVCVGNKVDLQAERVVEYSELSEIAAELNAIPIETSAVTGVGIEQMIQSAVAKVIEIDRNAESNPKGSSDQAEDKGKSNGPCC